MTDTIVTIYRLDANTLAATHHCPELELSKLIQVCGDSYNCLMRNNMINKDTSLLVFNSCDETALVPVLVSPPLIQVSNPIENVINKLKESTNDIEYYVVKCLYDSDGNILHYEFYKPNTPISFIDNIITLLSISPMREVMQLHTLIWDI